MGHSRDVEFNVRTEGGEIVVGILDPTGGLELWLTPDEADDLTDKLQSLKED